MFSNLSNLLSKNMPRQNSAAAQARQRHEEDARRQAELAAQGLAEEQALVRAQEAQRQAELEAQRVAVLAENAPALVNENSVVDSNQAQQQLSIEELIASLQGAPSNITDQLEEFEDPINYETIVNPVRVTHNDDPKDTHLYDGESLDNWMNQERRRPDGTIIPATNPNSNKPISEYTIDREAADDAARLRETLGRLNREYRDSVSRNSLRVS